MAYHIDGADISEYGAPPNVVSRNPDAESLPWRCRIEGTQVWIPPWIQADIANTLPKNDVFNRALYDKRYDPHPTLFLSSELAAFAAWIGPSEEERFARHFTLARFQKALDKLYSPNVCLAIPQGSALTGTSLPMGDLDIKLQLAESHRKKSPKSILREVAGALHGLTVYGHRESYVELVPAKVPIIKFVDPTCGVPVDVSVEMDSKDGDPVPWIQYHMTKHPALYPLILVLKYYFFQHSLNEPRSGGLSSYALVVMILCILNSHPEINSQNEVENLGVLFIEFFEFYCEMIHTAGRKITEQGPLPGVGKQFFVQSPFNPNKNLAASFWQGKAASACLQRTFDVLRSIGNHYTSAYEDFRKRHDEYVAYLSRTCRNGDMSTKDAKEKVSKLGKIPIPKKDLPRPKTVLGVIIYPNASALAAHRAELKAVMDEVRSRNDPEKEKLHPYGPPLKAHGGPGKRRMRNLGWHDDRPAAPYQEKSPGAPRRTERPENLRGHSRPAPQRSDQQPSSRYYSGNRGVRPRPYSPWGAWRP